MGADAARRADPGKRIDATASAEAGAAAAAKLVYVADDMPGIRRKRAGRAFSYLDADGARVRDAATLARIRKLAIPPAYTDVWICPRVDGHLQATGRDARGRKQYRYHPRWRQRRDADKYGRVIAFAERLPALRRRLRADLAKPALPREKVLAVAVSVLAETLIRVGNLEYARSNRSFGLTTLRDRHVAFLRGGRALFKFRGKGGLDHEIALDDRRLARLVRHCQALPGQQLFQYLDDDGARQPIDSTMVNDYLREAMGVEFTAKDFRTWGGTLRAVEILSATAHPEPPSERALASCVKGAIEKVAKHLGNTVAVCRASYIHPAVLNAWCAGELQARVTPELAKNPRKLEAAALKLLRAARRETARGAPVRLSSRRRYAAGGAGTGVC